MMTLQMRKIFDQSWKTLEKIGHIPVPDLQRMMDKECQVAKTRECLCLFFE